MPKSKKANGIHDSAGVLKRPEIYNVIVYIIIKTAPKIPHLRAIRAVDGFSI